MPPTSRARRPKGYVKRSLILHEMGLREKQPSLRKKELNAKFAYIHGQVNKWTKVIDAKNLAFLEFVRTHHTKDPRFREKAAVLARRILIAEKRIAPLYRKSLVLSIIHAIETTQPLPNGERALWARMNSKLQGFEKDEATVHRLLHDRDLFHDWVDGRIARIIER